ncbi:MAG: PIG-L deacetylase family protein [Nitrososphaeria archaeon]
MSIFQPYLFEESKKIVIEKKVEGKPYAGKVLAVVAPHADDFTIFCGGTVAKLIDEGCIGYFIRTSNDEADSYNYNVPETILHNDTEFKNAAKILGIKECFDLGYRNHRMDDVSIVELRSRLIFLFRLLKVDIVISFDPWSSYEENPDHYITAKAVEAAAWMAGGRLDYQEHFRVGLAPYAVQEKYYFSRGPQIVNRVVDISSTIDRKLAAIKANKTQIANMALKLKESLDKKRISLPILEGDVDSVIENYVETVFRKEAEVIGKLYGLKYAEVFHYIGPSQRRTHLDEYIETYLPYKNYGV